MKNYCLILALSVIAFAFSGCNGGNDEPDVPRGDEFELLTFSVENIINSENVKIEYYSPDPGCGIRKIYWITANNKAGEITLKCTNAEKLYIVRGYSYSENFTAEKEYWSVKVVDSNTVTFSFDEIGDNKIEPSYPGVGDITILSKSNDGEKKEFFYVRRFDTDTPLSNELNKFG
ncbi:MAG: hypothetical protein K2M00_03905 [Muribaculaceae bacterium]|nr:hypothetical protein [Muribaculaceae bacterium]